MTCPYCDYIACMKHELIADDMHPPYMVAFIGWEANPLQLYALSSQQWGIECSKAALQIGMNMLARKYDLHVHDLILLQDPFSVLAKKTLNKHSMHIVCCSTKVVHAGSKKGHKTPLHNIEAHVMDHAGCPFEFCISPHTVLPAEPEAMKEEQKDEKDKKDEKDEKGEKKDEKKDETKGVKTIVPSNNFVCPFWLVQKATEGEGNMCLATEVVEVGPFSVHVPIMTNIKRIMKDEVLMLSPLSTKRSTVAPVAPKTKAARIAK